MQGHSFTRYATLAALVAALACARNPEPDDPDQAAARDTTAADTLNAQGEPPSGYRGMEQDTTQTQTGQTPSDTFLQNQGTGTPQDTAGYSGMERTDTTVQTGLDTTAQTGQTDTTAQTGQTDTTGVSGDTTGTGTYSDTTNQSGQTTDSVPSGDTTGYDQSQQADSTNR
jgi:hypothetical protein